MELIEQVKLAIINSEGLVILAQKNHLKKNSPYEYAT